MDILIVVFFTFLGSLVAGFSVWYYMYLWGSDKKENDQLKNAQGRREAVFKAYQQIESAFREAGWKIGTSFVVLPLRLVIQRKLVSGGQLIAEFHPDEHRFQIFVLLPPYKIPPEYRDQRAEAGIESALSKSPQLKVYQVSEYAGTAWAEIAKRVMEAVETYEKEWSVIRPRITAVNRLLLNAVKEKSAFELRLKNEEAAFRARLDENLKKISEMNAEPKPVPDPKPESSSDPEVGDAGDFDLDIDTN